MSRIGIKSIKVPDGVTVSEAKGSMSFKGPKGDLSLDIPLGINTKVEENQIYVERTGNTKRIKAFHGMTRALINNSVIGVSEGFTKVLEIIGTGYKADLKGKDKLILNLGYSHPIEFDLPKGVEATVEDRGTKLSLSSIDKQLVGEIAARIRKLRKPDAYKGKGVRYMGEQLKLKPGKSGG